jgi:hypothetical protein
VTDAGDGPATAPVSMTDPPRSVRTAITAGARLVVVGQVHRRFFRVAGRTQSRTEVVARRVVGIRRAATATRLLADAVAAIQR